MKLINFIKLFIRNYFIILGVLIVVLVVTNIDSEATFSIHTLYSAMLFVLLGDLTMFILYTPNEISEKQMAVRKAIQFIVLEAVLLVATNVTGWVSGILNNIFFALEILLIYVVVLSVNWLNDKRTADAINAKLVHIKGQEADEDK